MLISVCGRLTYNYIVRGNIIDGDPCIIQSIVKAMISDYISAASRSLALQELVVASALV